MVNISFFATQRLILLEEYNVLKDLCEDFTDKVQTSLNY
jgi:hypothetical protein